MNAGRLLAHYEKIADAPDAIPRLRRFILDLAVRGKLVEQDPNDEPASELLKRINAKKAWLVKIKRIKNSKVDPVNEEVKPFNVPTLWQWTRLGAIGDWGAGSTPPRGNPDLYGGGLTWLKSGELNDNTQLRSSAETVTELAVQKGSFRINRPGDVLIAMYGATIGKLAILAEEAVTNQAVCACTPFEGVFNKYLFLFLLSERENFCAASEGGAQPNISKVKIIGKPVPLPPLAEQHRIVAKVDELMALCDRLETERTARETTRDRLTAATLARLNELDPDPAVFRNHAAFALDNLIPLTTRPNQIKALRQTILNLAVRGKLVKQNPSDEPASELLKRIAADRLKLEKSGALKKSKPLPEVDTSDAPFDLPEGWSWAHFPEVGLFGRGKSKHRPRNDPILYTDGKYPFVQTGDVARSGGLIETYSNLYNDLGLSQSSMWPAGTLCITIAANIADSGILSFDACFPDSVVGLIAHDSFEGARYFEFFVRTAKANLQEFAPSTAQKNINLGILVQLLIPLPPLSEQHRIVAKVDELMALCNQLETSLAAGDDTRRRMLDALFYEALEETLEPVKRHPQCVM